MTVENGRFRRAAKSAILADARFAGFTTFGIWDKRISEAELPAFGVGLPRWTEDPHQSNTSGESTANLIVAIKRADGDLEDLADEDAENVSRILAEAIQDESHLVSLQEATYQEDGSGERPVSTLSMMFTIKYWPAL